MRHAFDHAAAREVPAVAATLPRAAAAAVDWHAIVIGAGPAGAAVAIRLARAGRRVLLIDRGGMPRPKVCGACLSPRAVHELDPLVPGGTGPWLATAEALPLAAVRLLAGGRAARIAMTGGIVRSREALDTALVHAAIAAGAHWLPQTAVSSIRLEGPTERAAAPGRDAAHDDMDAVADGGVVVALAAEHCATEYGAAEYGAAEQAAAGHAAFGHASTGPQVRGRVAVIAAGLADTIRIAGDGDASPARPRSGHAVRGRRIDAQSRIGLGATLRGPLAAACRAGLVMPAPGELVMAVAAQGYCGLVTLEDGGIDLAAAVDRRLVARAGGPAGAVEAVLAEAAGGGLDADLLAAVRSATLRATPPLTHVSPLAIGGRIFRVGDAAGYVEPFTGEGIGWALAGGRLLAAALLGREPAAPAYAAAHARLFETARRRVWRVARGVRHPRLVAGAVRLAGAVPWMAARTVPLITGATATAGFASLPE
jgi:flavin-dependent dehydrogenase